jgi:pimeloyl-ACP methyl ester carboxylesterase
MTERRIARDDVLLHCVDEGEGPHVLLVHAGGADSSTWGQIATHLRERCHVITYDRRGYSRSTHAEKATLAQHGADAAAVVEALECGPVIVVALSAGATVALQLAVTRPDLVRGMVLHEPPFHAKRHPSLATIRAVIRMQRLQKQGHVVEAAESFMRWAYGYAGGASAYDAYPESWREVARGNAASTVNDVAAIATGETISRRQVGGLTMPVICSVGELSRPANRKTMRRLAAWLPNARLEVIGGAAHEVALTNPEAVARLALSLALGGGVDADTRPRATSPTAS